MVVSGAGDTPAPPTDQTRNHEGTKKFLIVAAISASIVYYLAR